MAGPMGEIKRSEYVEMLSRMAARLAGRDPDEWLTMKLADIVIFDDLTWRYPDFMTRGETAYALLTSPSLVRPSDVAAASGTLRFGDDERSQHA